MTVKQNIMHLNSSQWTQLTQLLLVLLAGVVLGWAPSVRAASFAATPCDPEYYKSLESRAWLEAQREITQNQNLIFKPDSVLEYTCFDKNLKELADHADEMFSETTRWGTILPNTSMDDALTNLVAASVSDYLSNNFGTNFLGERASGSYTPDSSITGGAYACSQMLDVWMEAKCMDFIDETATDGFFTFDDYQSDPDKRFPAGSCSGPGALWQDNIDIAKADGGTPWEFDDVVTYLDELFPTAGCGSSPSYRIRTGLTVKRAKASTPSYEEHACIVPGCYWDPSSSQCSDTAPP